MIEAIEKSSEKTETKNSKSLTPKASICMSSIISSLFMLQMRLRHEINDIEWPSIIACTTSDVDDYIIDTNIDLND